MSSDVARVTAPLIMENDRLYSINNLNKGKATPNPVTITSDPFLAHLAQELDPESPLYVPKIARLIVKYFVTPHVAVTPKIAPKQTKRNVIKDLPPPNKRKCRTFPVTKRKSKARTAIRTATTSKSKLTVALSPQHSPKSPHLVSETQRPTKEHVIAPTPPSNQPTQRGRKVIEVQAAPILRNLQALPSTTRKDKTCSTKSAATDSRPDVALAQQLQPANKRLTSDLSRLSPEQFVAPSKKFALSSHNAAQLPTVAIVGENAILSVTESDNESSPTRATDPITTSLLESKPTFTRQQPQPRGHFRIPKIARLKTKCVTGPKSHRTQPVVRRKVKLTATGAKACETGFRLMDLPQELLDAVLEYVYPSGPGVEIISKGMFEMKHRLSSRASLQYPEYCPTSPAFLHDPDYAEAVFVPKVNEFLVAKRYFYSAAKLYVQKCHPQHNFYRPCSEALVVAFARHAQGTGIFADRNLLQFAHLKVVTLNLNMRNVLVFGEYGISDSRTKGKEWEEAVAEARTLHDRIIGEAEMLEKIGEPLKILLKLRGIVEVKFVWSTCWFCGKEGSRACKANTTTYETLVTSNVTQPREEGHHALESDDLHLFQSNKEAANPLYPGSEVSWDTPKASDLSKFNRRKTKKTTTVAPRPNKRKQSEELETQPQSVHDLVEWLVVSIANLKLTDA
ncbi:hypothetical protein MBLNU230_g6067t1 [Neophaeotheca triangularis]